MRIGPSVKLELSCFDCEHCKTTSYTCQGDSGSDIYCGAANMRRVGDTCWKTPEWCPFRADAIHAAIVPILSEQYELVEKNRDLFEHRSFNQMTDLLRKNGIATMTEAQCEVARIWRAGKISDADLITALQAVPDR